MKLFPIPVLLLILVLGPGCHLIDPDIGRVELPVSPSSLQEIEARSAEEFAKSEVRSLEDDSKRFDDAEPIPRAEVTRVPLGLDEIRMHVLEGNLDLRVQRLEPEQARARISQEEAKFDALIRADGGYARKESPRLDGPLVDFDSDNPALDGEIVKLTEIEAEKEFVDFGAGLEIPLPTGGVISLDTVFAGDRTSDPQRFEQFVSATRFSLSQPLLRGAGTTPTLASIRLARVEERQAEARTKLAALSLLARAEKAYWEVYAADRIVDIRTEQLRLAVENLEMVQRRVDEGLSAEVEIVRSRLGVTQRWEAHIIAETRFRQRQRKLKALINVPDLPLNSEPMIEVSSQPRLVGFECDPELLVAEALSTRLELIELELQLVQDDIEIDFLRNEVLPLLNLDFEFGTSDRARSYESAWTDSWRFDNPYVAVGVGLELPLTNQRRRAELAESILQRAQRYATRSARELAVEQEVLDTLDALSQNWQRVLAARQNVIVAGVNYEAEQRQFQEGFRTMREVFEALSDLGDAQLREVRAIVDYQISQIDLAFATGTLFGYTRVSLEPETR